MATGGGCRFCLDDSLEGFGARDHGWYGEIIPCICDLAGKFEFAAVTMKVCSLDFHFLKNIETPSLGFSAVDDDGQVVFECHFDERAKYMFLLTRKVLYPVIVETDFTDCDQLWCRVPDKFDLGIDVERFRGGKVVFPGGASNLLPDGIERIDAESW